MRFARKAYQQFLREGLSLGHQPQYYETVDQRFLGDARFLEEIQRKTDAKHDVTVKGPRVPFSRLLPAVAHATGVPVDQLVRVGRGPARVGGTPGAAGVYGPRVEWDDREAPRTAPAS